MTSNVVRVETVALTKIHEAEMEEGTELKRDKNGQNQELVHQWDSTGGKVWRENT